MKQKTAKSILNCMGATFAVCSLLSMVGGTKICGASSTKKAVKKTVNKMADVVDAISAIM